MENKRVELNEEDPTPPGEREKIEKSRIGFLPSSHSKKKAL